MKTDRRVVIVHDWLTGMRGGEAVLEVLLELFPAAPVVTLVHRTGSCSPSIESRTILTSLLQRLPWGSTKYQRYLPLFPLLTRTMKLPPADLVISSSHAVAKGIAVPEGVPHICYCHTPMRYIWDQFDDYFGGARAWSPAGMVMRLLRGPFRRWDLGSAARVTRFIANSENVRERISRIYRRDADVIYPPVDLRRFSVSTAGKGYFLVVAGLVPYKRIDLAVRACNLLGKRLVVVGGGTEEGNLRRIAGPTIEFTGRIPDGEVVRRYRECEALIFPGEEDFGIVPLEAMACGKPVIAFGRGGALETVVDGVNGLFFPRQSEESLIEAIGRFGTLRFDPAAIARTVVRFDRPQMKEALAGFFRAQGLL